MTDEGKDKWDEEQKGKAIKEVEPNSCVTQFLLHVTNLVPYNIFRLISILIIT